jgi:osmotically-inducible protein OsmY
MKHFPRAFLFNVLMCSSALLLNACLGLAAGAGATAGIAATQEGGIKGAVDDVAIKASINDLWFKSNVDIFRKLNLTVDQGRVLITGVVQNPEHRVEAVRLAWQPKGVKQVINEIRVADSEGVQGYVSDSWVTAQLRTKLTIDADVQSINYSIDTVQGIVYLMGAARNQAELNKVIDTARNIKNVKQVVSYVKMLGEPIQVVTPGNAPNMAPTPAQQPVSGYPVTQPAPVPSMMAPSPATVTSQPLTR